MSNSPRKDEWDFLILIVFGCGGIAAMFAVMVIVMVRQP